MDNEEVISTIRRMLMGLYGNTSVTKRQTYADLEEIKDEIIVLQDALGNVDKEE